MGCLSANQIVSPTKSSWRRAVASARGTICLEPKESSAEEGSGRPCLTSIPQRVGCPLTSQTSFSCLYEDIMVDLGVTAFSLHDVVLRQQRVCFMDREGGAGRRRHLLLL